MKPVFTKIQEDGQMNVFAIREIDLPYFSTEFHFHKECQMVYVVESEGKRIIGDSVEDFTGDELILLGPDIPHVWHNSQPYFDHSQHRHARSLALFFHPDKLQEAMDLFGLSRPITSLMKKARRGMQFKGRTKKELKQMLIEMTTQSPLLQMSTFIRILEKMAQTRDYELLASEGYVNTYQSKDNERIDQVFSYVFHHFKQDIKLEEVAGLVNMNKQAFCRYFKSRTQKTFVQFLNEIRIGHACKLMAEGHRQVASLAYECGFNSLSNFNRFFREIRDTSPREYMKMLGTS